MSVTNWIISCSRCNVQVSCWHFGHLLSTRSSLSILLFVYIQSQLILPCLLDSASRLWNCPLWDIFSLVNTSSSSFYFDLCNCSFSDTFVVSFLLCGRHLLLLSPLTFCFLIVHISCSTPNPSSTQPPPKNKKTKSPRGRCPRRTLIGCVYTYSLFWCSITICSFPEWELRMQKLKSRLVRTQSLKVLPLKPRVGKYIAIHATLTARDFFLAYFHPSFPFTCNFSKTSPNFFPVLAVANTGFCVGQQNKIGHPVGWRFPCWVPSEYKGAKKKHVLW